MVLLMLFGIITSLYAENEKFKALFIYNFTKYINWPQGNSQGDFVIGIVGKSPIADEIKQIASSRTVNGRNIVVREFASTDDVTRTAILFIPEKSKNNIGTLSAKAKAWNALVIAESPDACKNGAALNFFTKNGKLNFEISRKNLEASGLQVDSKLFTLGVETN